MIIRMFKKTLKQNQQIFVYFLIETFLAIGGTFSHTTYYIYLTTSLGLSNKKAMFLDTVLFIFVFFFEVPTGAIGDKFGRKFSFVIARILLALTALSYFIFTNYSILVFLSILFALGIAFQSGAYEALIIDQVNKKKYTMIFTIKDTIRKVSTVTMPIIAIAVAERTSYAFPYLVSFFCSISTVIITTIFLKENRITKQNELSNKKGLEVLLEIGLNSIKTSFNSIHLRIILLSSFLSSLAMICINSYSSKLIELNVKPELVGIIISASSIVSIIVSVLISKFKSLKSNFISISILGSVTLILLGVVDNPVLITFLFIVQTALISVYFIQQRVKFNELVRNNRATMISILSLVGSISGVIGTILFGYLADALSIKATFGISGIFMLMSVIVLKKVLQRK